MVQSITESENGGPDASGSGETAGRAVAAGLATAAPSAAPAQVPKNSRRRMSGSQQFVANVLQNVSGAFDADFSRKNRVLVFDAEDAFVADVHIRLHDGLPKAGAVA